MEAAQERSPELSWLHSQGLGEPQLSLKAPNPWITEKERSATFVHSLPKATYWTKLPDPLVLLWAPPASAPWFTTAQQRQRPPAPTQPHPSPASAPAATLCCWQGFGWGPALPVATKHPTDMHWPALPSQHTSTLPCSPHSQVEEAV